MCGMQLNAMRCWNTFTSSSSSGVPSRNALVWSYSSAMAGAPPPLAAW